MSITFNRSDSIDLTGQDLINMVQTWLGTAIGDFNRYSQAQIIQSLNLGMNKFTLFTECLTMPVLVVAQNNIQNYQLPGCVLKINSGRYYFGSDRMSYQELCIKRSMKALQDEMVDFRGDTGTPAYYMFPSYRGGLVQFGISLFPTTDGATFNAGNSGCVAFAPGTAWPGSITGTNETAGLVYVDSGGRNLSQFSIIPGLPVFNITQNLSGLVAGLTTTTSTNDTILVNGITSWEVGDQVIIPLSNWGLAIDAPAGNLWTFTSLSTDGTGLSTGTVGDITAFTDNIMLDVVRKPMPINASYLSMVPEIPIDYAEAAAAWAVYLLGRSKYKGMAQDKKATDAKARFEELVAEFKGQMPFEDQSENATVYYEIYD